MKMTQNGKGVDSHSSLENSKLGNFIVDNDICPL